MRLFFCFFMVAFSFTWNLRGEEKIYLSPLGDDMNRGCEKYPLATLEGVRDKIRKTRMEKSFMDTLFVEIQPGTYYITHAFQLTEEDSGMPSAPVVFRGDKNKRPVICGGRRTGRFEEIASGLWRVFIPEVAELGFYFEQLYVNGERRFRAQTPDKGSYMFPKRVEETILDSSEKKNPGFASQKLVIRADDLPSLSSYVA